MFALSPVTCVYCAGVEVPSKDSMPKKKPVYGDKRKKKPNAQTPEGTASRQQP